MLPVYETYLPSIQPPPLKGPWAKKFFGAVGKQMDTVAQRYRDATFARLAAYATGEQLDLIGQERKLPRGPAESDGDCSARLIAAWDTWAGDNVPLTGKGGGAGSHLGMLLAIKAAGILTGSTGATIVQQNGRYSQLDGSGNLVLGTLMDCVNRVDLQGTPNARPGWMFEARDNFYSEFGIVFPVDTPVPPAVLNAAVEQWRPSKALYIGAWIIQAGRLLGWPAGARTLGTEPNLGGNTIVYIPPPRGDNVLIGYAP